MTRITWRHDSDHTTPRFRSHDITVRITQRHGSDHMMSRFGSHDIMVRITWHHGSDHDTTVWIIWHHGSDHMTPRFGSHYITVRITWHHSLNHMIIHTHLMEQRKECWTVWGPGERRPAGGGSWQWWPTQEKRDESRQDVSFSVLALGDTHIASNLTHVKRPHPFFPNNTQLTKPHAI